MKEESREKLRGGAAKQPDLGQGSVGRLMLGLVLPAVVAQLVNMLYNIIDRIYIGHMPGTGPLALTGVGLCFAIIMLITAFSSLVGMGAAPRMAIAMGQGRQRDAEKILGNGFALLLALSAVLLILFEAVAEPVLLLFGASANTLPFALSYLRVYVLGTPFIMLVMGLNPLITAQGFSQISMLTTVLGAGCNIVLDPILIFGCGLGVRGAAIATAISQAVSAGWVLLFLVGPKPMVRLRRDCLRPSAAVLLPCLALGISPFVMQSTEALLNVSFNSSLSRYGGDIAVGAMTILSSCMQLTTLPLMGVCQGGQPLMSFNFGAGKPDRVRRTFRLQFGVCMLYATLFFLLCMAAPQVLARIFADDAELVAYTAWSLRVYAAGVFAVGAQISCQQGFLALGQAKISLLLACLRKLILLIPLIFILPCFLPDKVFAVLVAEPVSDILAASATAYMFFTRFDRILEAGPQGGKKA